MKKIALVTFFTLFFAAGTGHVALADIGEAGFFGGITDGSTLPKMTDIKAKTEKKRRTRAYKEVVFVSGEPVTFEGVIAVDAKNQPVEFTEPAGAYAVTFTVAPGDGADADGVVSINRAVTFDVRYRKEGRQVIKDYEPRTWSETIVTPAGEFSLDPVHSRFNVSVIEDHAPGVVYYKGDISQRRVYNDAENKITALDSSGAFYGYSCALSAAEAHRIDITAISDGFQAQYQVRPAISSVKILRYGENEPDAISFSGNYREITQSSSGLEYNIYEKPQYIDVPTFGREYMPVYNSFEQLISPDLGFLKGHFAEEAITKLFATQVFENDPLFFKPAQVMTRGQFISAVARAIKLRLPDLTPKKGRSKKSAVIDDTDAAFGDAAPDRPDYGYIMAANAAGLIFGRDNGSYYPDNAITREEAAVIIMRALGLESISPDAASDTPFADGSQISDWARRSMNAARFIGILNGDGFARPDETLSKADAALLLNAMTDYMRYGLSRDYTEHIVNYAD
ncbi:MAG: S-layer homology domain-containing protein [Clostridiales bacterium]|nr:S-layer homology domain-containing protein [Clostridiales bacterium]